MDIGAAFTNLKAGRCVARSPWLSKGLTLCLVSGLAFKVSGGLVGLYPDGSDVRLAPLIAMSVGGGLLVAWQPTQSDLLADDWIALEMTAPAAKPDLLA